MELNEFESKKMLSDMGISIPQGSIVKTANDARREAERIGYPVVLKIVSKDIVHKSDCGGVILNVTKENIKKEFVGMLHKLGKKFPHASYEGVYVQKMDKNDGLEIIIGIKNDTQFGKIILIGMGGIYAEVMNDTSMRILPINKDDVKQMISETKIGKILMGLRGKVYDINGIIDTIIKVCDIAEKYNIKELDINPLKVHENNCVAIDARILI